MSILIMKSKGSVDKNSIHEINISSKTALTASNVLSLNRVTSNNASMPHSISTPTQAISTPVQVAASTPLNTQIAELPMPALMNPVQKGQKIPLFSRQDASYIKACLGWNVLHPQCDIDVSAFLLGANDQVIGDAWFVFYGQTDSPDQSTHFIQHNKDCREAITIDFKKLSPNVKKIVFVLTINEALQKNLNFSMVKDAYIRLIDERTKKELTSFKMTDYYANVISMMIGEIYMHNDTWKFNAVGNGVARDLAGLCSLYGVQVDD